MKTAILIFPYSGTGIEALDCLGDNYECIGFVSDDLNFIGTRYHDIEIFDRSIMLRNAEVKVLAVHGSPQSYLQKEQTQTSLNISTNRFVTVIHPSASVSKYSKIGKNVLIMAGTIIGPEVIIEDNVIILPNSTIHHNSIVKEHSIICGNVLIAGNVTISKNCYVGAGSSIISGCVIGTNSLIGIGSNVLKDTDPNSKSAGNPAKKIN